MRRVLTSIPNHDDHPRMHVMVIALGSLLLALVASLPAAEPGPGVPNVAYDPATHPAGTLLSAEDGYRETNTTAGDFPVGVFAGTIGRGPTAMSIHRGYLVAAGEGPGQKTGSDVRHMAWDLSDPTNPQEVLSWGGQAGYNAHGSIKAGEVWRSGGRLGIDDDGNLDTSARFDARAHWSRGGLWTGWRVSFNWSYGTPEDPYVLDRYDYENREWVEQARWNHLAETGVPGHPFIIGNLLIIASDQADRGVTTYDISDPTNPVLLDHINGGVNGIGGYWTEVWKGFLIFPRRKNGGIVQIVDYRDPTDLKFVQELVIDGNAMYAQFQDDYAFIERAKIDLSQLESGGTASIALSLDEEGTGIDVSQFGLPAGNLWITGGIQGRNTSQGAAVWIHDTQPDNTGPTIGYHIPRDGTTDYSIHCPITMLVHETCETANLIDGETIVLREVASGDTVSCDITFSFNDILAMTPKADLMPGTQYEVLLTTDALTDAVENPLVDVTGAGDTYQGKDIAYSFTFTTDDGTNPRPTIDAFTASQPSPYETGTSVTFDVSASDDDTLEYRIDYGDGDLFNRSRTEWSTDTSWTHTFDTPGAYKVTVQAREVGTLTRLVTASMPVVVHAPIPANRPTQSGTIAADATNRQVWAVNPDNDSVVRIDADSANRLGSPITVGDHPFNVAVDRNGRAWVTCRDDDTIHVLNADGTGDTTLNLDYGDRPTAIVFDPTGTTGYIALDGTSEIVTVDADSRASSGKLSQRNGLNIEMFQWRGDPAPWAHVDEISFAADYQPNANNTKLAVGIYEGTPSADIKWEFSDNFAKDGDKLNFQQRKLGGNFATIFRGFLDVPTAGEYTFWVNANDGQRLTIAGEVVSEDNTLRDDRDTTESSGTISLTTGRHPIEIRFFENDNREHLEIEWAGPGIERTVVPRTAFYPAQDVRRFGALAVSADGSTLLGTQLISDDHAGRIARYHTDSDTWAPTYWLVRDTFTDDNGAASRGVPNYLRGLTVNFSGDEAWYAGKKDNTLVGHFQGGDDPTFETSVRAILGPLDLTVENPREAETPNVLGKMRRKDIDNHAMPSHAIHDPLGTMLLVTMQANNRLIAFDNREASELARIDVGLAPDGVAVDPDTNRIFVKNLMDRTVTVIDGSGLITTGARNLDQSAIIATIDTVDSDALSTEEVRGKQLFYSARDIDLSPGDTESDTSPMTTDGYISCAVCHLDGGHDGRTWDFTHRGEGLRNTTTLRGRRGTGHGPVHWSGNFDEIQDFELDIVNHFGGDGFLMDDGGPNDSLGSPNAGRSADLDALAAYVTSLDAVPRSPYRAANGSKTSDGDAGRQLFMELNCASCHSGPDFTDSAMDVRHDIGTIKASSGTRLEVTLDGIDTPSLKGLWATAPYLHDGSAGTLAAVFANVPRTTVHGRVQDLTTEEQSQLMSFLAQIDESEPEVPASEAPGLVAVSLSLNGRVEPGSQLVSIDGTTAVPDENGFFTISVPVQVGTHTLPVVVTDADGNTSRTVLTLPESLWSNG